MNLLLKMSKYFQNSRKWHLHILDIIKISVCIDIASMTFNNVLYVCFSTTCGCVEISELKQHSQHFKLIIKYTRENWWDWFVTFRLILLYSTLMSGKRFIIALIVWEIVLDNTVLFYFIFIGLCVY